MARDIVGSMKIAKVRIRNPGKKSWFAIGVGAGVVVSAVAAAGYVFRRLQKL